MAENNTAKPADDEDWISLAEAIKQLNRGRRSIQRLVKAGHLRCKLDAADELYHQGDIRKILSLGISAFPRRRHARPRNTQRNKSEVIPPADGADDNEKWLSVGQAIMELKRGERSVQRLVQAGHLRCKKDRDGKLYHQGDIQRILNLGITTSRNPQKDSQVDTPPTKGDLAKLTAEVEKLSSKLEKVETAIGELRKVSAFELQAATYRILADFQRIVFRCGTARHHRVVAGTLSAGSGCRRS